MDPVRRLQRPALRRPRALLAFAGWNDASEAASGPTVEIDAGGTRRLTWPSTRFYAIEQPDGGGDLVIVVGDEPQLRWKTYARLLVQILADTDVEKAVTLGAFIGQVPHTVPVPLVGVATDPGMVDRAGLPGSRYEGPTGIVGVVLEAFREMGTPALSLWAAVPHYLAANANPMAMLALLSKASSVLDTSVDLAELERLAAEFRERVDEAMHQSNDLEAYIRRIEEEAGDQPAIDPGDAPSLITEIEQFLRNRDA
jgi:proteasome assembly chaperone (PAC2) family protein